MGEQPEPDVFKVSVLNEESIILGFHLTKIMFRDILSNFPSSTYVLITDKNIAPIYLSRIIDNFREVISEMSLDNASKLRLITYLVSPGEQSKSRDTKAEIEDFLLSKACGRDTCIFAMGGGVIGDLVGFVAATFMRGVPFVQVPTSLLAMVDSSIGGKTAVDTPHGKNLIGSFWQPKRIYIDLTFLETLPEREFTNGMAEVIKTAAISSESEFINLENGVSNIREAVFSKSNIQFQGATLATRTPSQSLLLSVIMASAKFKADVVTHDERESGLRGLLNFGHTIGHAIEAILSPELLHGECVSIGMMKEAEIARNLGYLNQVAVSRLCKVLQDYGLPVSLDEKKVKDLVGKKFCTVDKLMEIMKVDKKNQGDQKKIVMLSSIGNTYEKKATIVSDSVIRKILSPAIKVLPFTSNISSTHVTMTTPGSKSISNRALILAALGNGTCRLKGPLYSDDTQVMMVALQKLKGAKFEWENDGETLVVTGGGGSLQVPDDELYLGNAGTASRFLTTVCTLISAETANQKKCTILTGNARMKQRPIGPLVMALQENGSQIRYVENEGSLPIEITPSQNKFKGGKMNLSASISSQYVTSILLSAPYASEPVTLSLTGDKVISQPYIDMTIAMMESFGIKIERLEGNIYRIPQGKYTNPSEYVIESDTSSATYPLAVAAITGITCTLPNIGTTSLQGDAAFAVKVLEPMGCTVTQTETSTTVQGPPIGSLRPLPNIDMETMTDAFLTASVLAAVALNNEEKECITRITGIANQRVKECNRISVMVHELNKFGVIASELPDGIQIHGSKIQFLKGPVDGVKCHDDHRIAMSFSVLGCVVPDGTIIREKKCVEKTWPEWWDDFESKLKMNTVGIDSESHHDSIIFIGMRGVGKTTLGREVANALNQEFLDLDQHFEAILSTPIPNFIEEHGWDAFRAKEFEILRSLLNTHASDYIITCGGGVVEYPPSRELLKQYSQNHGDVVHIVRDINDVIRYLNRDASRPSLSEDLLHVWNRRKPFYNECSNIDINTINTFGRMTVENLVEIIRKTRRTFFISLTFPDITPALKIMPTITHGVDAIELRVDLLSENGDIPSVEYICGQLASLRRSSSLPIIFTVRSQSQGGKYPDTQETEYFNLLEQAIKNGCEYVDVEIHKSPTLIENLIKMKGDTKIIASWHDLTGTMKWDGEEVRRKFRAAHNIGDIIKIVGRAKCLSDNFRLREFVEWQQQHIKKPIIAINMDVEGQLSRILNQTFTPVTHPLLPLKAAPGQLSVAEIHKGLHLIGQLPKKKFYLFGNPIVHSMSPTIHNTGFEILGLPHHYDLFESENVEAVKPIIEDIEFGGASVTIPHKISIIPFLDQISVHSKSIGAVNTIIVTENETGRKLIGENTDWLGIFYSIKPLIEINSETVGLVIGGGGTSRAGIYALHQLGLQTIYLYNRTQAKIEELKNQFPKYGIVGLSSLSDEQIKQKPPQIIVSTIPATSNIEIPYELFASGKGGVIVEMAYKPRRTQLLEKGAEKGWIGVEGIQVLIEQGLCQFEEWTGRRAPRNIIEENVYRKYNNIYS
ncbi:hypothetical protein RclHR1_06490002 [Rhizophagus clarus]|uniref:Pentafunctional AROM polypeptide n=1 Tax=Rhizophagus clarus TaxID=94130 RepID=A0A2Z6SIN4_9GLOM|nr:hypothetical protein RclHR1_06490002 [Rhizophagus clarus]